jgi:hypothetical protein
MRWLRAVIARLLGLQTQHLDSHAQPTQTAGHALPEPTAQAGNKPSAQATQRRPRPRPQLPAQPRSQKKPKSVSSTSAASKDTSKKPKAVATAKSRKAAGNFSQTPASGTRPHAKRQPKPKH